MLSLFRTFRITERLGAQLRGEALQRFEHAALSATPRASVSSGGFMTITSALGRSDNNPRAANGSSAWR